MKILRKDQFREQRNWTSIFLWSLGIAVGIFSLMWLRVGYLDPYLNDKTDAMLFFMPHTLIIFWGITVGFFSQKNIKKSYPTPIQNPFVCVFLTAIIFDVIFSFWTAYMDRHLNIDPSTPYIFLAIRSTLLDSWIAVAWIAIPFFIGYIPAKIVSLFNKKFSEKVWVLLK